jgi:hypothetical protein
MREIQRIYDFPEIVDASDCTFEELCANTFCQDGGGINVAVDVNGTRQDISAMLRKLADAILVE